MSAPHANAAVAEPDSAVLTAMAQVFGPDGRADPYTPARVLREAGPLHRTPLGHHVLTRYEDCAAVLSTTAWSHAEEAAMMHPTVSPDDAAEELPTSFLWMEPPDHTRLRNLVTKGFTPRMVTRLRPRIELLCEELIDNALQAREFDLVEMIAYPLPLIVACELIGVPQDAYAQVHRWSQDLARGFDHDYTLPEEALRARSAGSRGFMAYFRELLNQRRTEPADDLLSVLSQVEDRGDVLTEQELLATCITTFVAGHETTANLIGTGMLRLLRDPGQLAVLRERPDLLASAPDELLRLDPSVQMTTRAATRPLTVAGHDFEPGEGVVVLITSANRDADAYSDPDRMDVARYSDPMRPAKKHLGFSLGIHYCLGAPLALLEMEVLLEVLLRKVGDMSLCTAEPVFKPNVVIRGLERLPVEFTAR
ncbi:cytochrome P450 [Nocardia otitidiscaviarum]|uniref:Cytochrome P450 n=1 Tax=Nocardia otitidiscaviarum TaxID=1823 RepID=A0A516NHX1_9NOCA|nr:cytochrome P450 [Nocardia otitidiscaviarum]MBF6134876.1 cytochrome P450 [Nocardia otitidiscaviarum]MBF6177388.1 cytochrome P450 [Nocardia otitidiscaviarum]MBF6485498.1 cytochrome P450 [Nocardia otitidiscaviarum]MCP9618718.1 cytochrome P450 [Nocardia otitidiscaviarum]QDP78502.1 cytochrome P450 [Nocardia otitidiscaviarum]